LWSICCRCSPKQTLTPATPFKLAASHAIVGVIALLGVAAALAPLPLRELRPFVTPLGSSAIWGQVAFLLGMLALPVAFLFNLLPRWAMPAFRPASLNLIIGAVILLVIIALASGLILENIACASGVPNCD